MSPYLVRKLPNKNKYEVYNKLTGEKHATQATEKNAKAQFRLLNALHNKDFKKRMLG